MDRIWSLKLQSAFFRDWGQFWNRDDEIDPSVVSMLESVPPEWRNLSENTRIQLTDLKQAIRQTKTTTAPGCCGWTQPDLMCVPDVFLENLIALWNGFLDGHCSWPTNLHFAKIVTPKKKEITLSMMDVRPITILSLLYRVLSKTWTKKLLFNIAMFAPWPIRGSLMYRSSQDLYMFLH